MRVCMDVIIWLNIMVEFIHKKTVLGYVYNMNQVFLNHEKTLSIKEESNLFFKAQQLCINDLNLIALKTTGIVKDIIRVHQMFLEDPKVIDETLALIQAGHSRGYSYSVVVDKYIGYLKNNGNDYLRQRIDDFIDIKYRMLMRMYQKTFKQSFTKDTILVVDVLLPSMVLNAHPRIKGIISKTGSHLTHAAILAKEKDIAYVISNQRLKDDTIVMLDSETKTIIENPTDTEVEEKLTESVMVLDTAYDLKDIKLYLNISHNEKLTKNMLKAIAGIGLFRTEHILIGSQVYPTRDIQTKIYQTILKQLHPKKVRVRLFDFTGDKAPYFLGEDLIKEYRFYDMLHEIYKEQIEALLKANEGFGNLEVMIPMVRDKKEYDNVKMHLQEQHQTLKLKTEIPQLGIMLETKEAYENLEAFKEVAFMSIGTNDLSKELLNIDRDQVIDYDSYTNQMIKPIQTITNFCRRYGIEYTLCGDLASNQQALFKLLNHQEKHFSMPKTAINQAIKTIVSYHNHKESHKKI